METIKAYPNPASTLLHLDIPAGFDIRWVYIYNTNGLLSQTIDVSASRQINISRLPVGVYYLLFKEQPNRAVRFVKALYSE